MDEKISIQIGLLIHQPGWQILLDQIGVAWSIVDLKSSDLFQRYSLIVANRPLDSYEEVILNDYTERGGALLHTPSNHAFIAAKAISKKYIASLPPRHTPWYRYHSILDLYHPCFFFAGNELLTVEKKANGIVSYLGFEVNSLLTNGRTTRKNFYTETARLPNEIVSKASKATIRQLLTSHIEYLHHQRNIPFVHKWYYPGGGKSVFTFRIDSDKGSREEIEELFQLSERYRIPTTWFLDVKSHEAWLPYFKKFTSQEIGIHCYEHVVYNSTVLNEENFLKARTKLNGVVNSVNGIAAPTGAWNTSLQSAFENLDLMYSSEFSFDYDNFPSAPWIHNRFSPALQIPIHPVCIGSMRRARMTSEEMFQWFKTYIDAQLILNEPICLYHHPTHAYNEVIEKIFQYINEQAVPKMSFTDYARWWKRRLSEQPKISFNGKTIFVESCKDSSIWLNITQPSGKMNTAQTDTEIRIAELNFHESSFPQNRENVMRARQFDPRHLIQNFLDWWIKVTE